VQLAQFALTKTYDAPASLRNAPHAPERGHLCVQKRTDLVKKPMSLLDIARRMKADKEAKAEAERAQKEREAATETEAKRQQILMRTLDGLEKLVERLKKGEVTYSEVRLHVLKFHAHLNKSKYVAPAFRPLIIRRKGMVDGDMIFRDQMRIDMHWLAIQDCQPTTSIGRDAISAIAAGGIDASGCEPYLNLSRKMKARAAELGADRSRQLECIWICNASLREQRNGAIDNARRHHRELYAKRRRGASTPRLRSSLERIDIDKVCSAWLAHQLTVILRGADPSVSQQLVLYRLITGDQSASRYALNRLLRQAEKHIH
jgi:hypothetical protein